MSMHNHDSSHCKELIQFIELHFKDLLKIDYEDEETKYYEEPHLCIIQNKNLVKIHIPINDTLEKNNVSFDNNYNVIHIS